MKGEVTYGMLMTTELSMQYAGTHFHYILYTVLNILIGSKFGNLHQEISITVKIRAINYVHNIRLFCLKPQKYSVN